jgi:hypothetical protein
MNQDRYMEPVCMFDKFHVTCNPKSKVSRDVFKNKIMSIDIYILFQNVTSIFGLHNILENKFSEWFVTKKLSIERKYPSVSHVSPNVEDGRPIHCIHFKPTKRNPHKSIKGLQVQPIAQVAFDCIFICILQHSPIYVWNYPCSYICNCLKMPKYPKLTNIVISSFTN